MMGELTPAIAEAVSSSNAKKLLLALNRSNVHIIGNNYEPLPHLAANLVKQLRALMKQ